MSGPRGRAPDGPSTTVRRSSMPGSGSSTSGTSWASCATATASASAAKSSPSGHGRAHPNEVGNSHAETTSSGARVSLAWRAAQASAALDDSDPSTPTTILSGVPGRSPLGSANAPASFHRHHALSVRVRSPWILQGQGSGSAVPGTGRTRPRVLPMTRACRRHGGGRGSVMSRGRRGHGRRGGPRRPKRWGTGAIEVPRPVRTCWSKTNPSRASIT